MDRYEIRVAGLLGERRVREFGAVEAHCLDGGNTSLVVRVRDQAALHGLLALVRDLGLELLEVRRTEREPIDRGGGSR